MKRLFVGIFFYLTDMMGACLAQEIIFELPPVVPNPGGITKFGENIFLRDIVVEPGIGWLYNFKGERGSISGLHVGKVDNQRQMLPWRRQEASR